MNQNVHLFDLFDACIKIEGVCAELYYYYASIFRDTPEIEAVWIKAAAEEEAHQQHFQFAARLLRDVEFEVLIKPQRAIAVFTKLTNLMQHVKANPPDLVTALEKSIVMEEQLADLHLLSAMDCKDESLKNMFQRMHGFDKDHILALKRQLTIETLHQAEMAG